MNHFEVMNIDTAELFGNFDDVEKAKAAAKLHRKASGDVMHFAVVEMKTIWTTKTLADRPKVPPTNEERDTKPYITVTLGGAGYFAVHMWFNPDMGGFWEPFQTGIGRYKTRGEAVQEAKIWADAENMEYREDIK